MLNIKNPRAHKLAVEVAQATGETLTEAVIHSLEERLARKRDEQPRREMDMERINALLSDIRARLPASFMRDSDPTAHLYDAETGAHV